MELNFRLDGKVAVITGGAQGLGFMMAEALSSAGADIVIGDVKVAEAGAAALNLSEQYHNRTLAVQLDVSNRQSVEQAAQKVLEKFGKVDVLVNNAGVLVQKSIEETVDEEWDYLMNINLKGVYLCSQVFGRTMIAQRSGKIINISSVVGFVGAENRILYGTSKSGVGHMTKLIATEWAKYNINANAIAPGYLLSEMTAKHFNDPVTGQEFLSKVPLKRFGSLNDVSGSVVFLASGVSDYITGQVLFVDGGRMLV